jgi:hypothetical protein
MLISLKTLGVEISQIQIYIHNWLGSNLFLMLKIKDFECVCFKRFIYCLCFTTWMHV